MESIADISFTCTKENLHSYRAALLKELYVLYTSQPDINQKENRTRYHAFVRVHDPRVCQKAGFSKAKYDKYKSLFKKAKLPQNEKYLIYIPENKFWYKFIHLKGDEGNDALRYMIAVAKDKLHRNENVAKYILGSIKFHVENI